MRSPAVMSTIQVELTSACVLRCSNCTRFCGTHRVPFFLEDDQFYAAIDSLIEYSAQPHAMVGFMGGEPLLHPKFPEFCEYAASRIPREKLGLWSTFPAGGKYRQYREIICRTFGNILLNDHSRDDILHAPVLMASEEYFRKACDRCDGGKNGGTCEKCGGSGTITDDFALFQAVDHCWIQESWSASINPKGAWFCEVAAALSDLFDGPRGWEVEPGWWKRTPEFFREQMDWACRKCGAALPIARIRNSQDNRDDVSPGNLNRLRIIKSRKVDRGEFVLREAFEFDQRLIDEGTYPDQTYKDAEYRKGIANRYEIALVMNGRGFWEPRLFEEMTKPGPALTLQSVGPFPTGVLASFHEAVARTERSRKAKLSAEKALFSARLAAAPDDDAARLRLSRCCLKSGDGDQSLSVLLEGLGLAKPGPALYWGAVTALRREGFTDRARRLAGEALALFPGHLEFRLAHHMMLPMIYSNEEEIGDWRSRALEGLRTIVDGLGNLDTAACAAAARGLSKWDNFLLAYQGRNDILFQKEYGAFVHRIISGAFPDDSALERDRNSTARRIRVGFLSAHLLRHTVGVLFLGWLTSLNKADFEIFSYHSGSSQDEFTDRFRQASEHFFQSTDLETLVRQLRHDRPDILVYLDIGMNSRASQLAALRLAPVQCATWGHPVTSGLPTVDYFLSSHLMEQDNAQQHYSETLVRLPGISINYDVPPILRSLVTARRSDFGLRDEGTLYLCCQSNFKYLPQYDFVFAKIASRVPGCQFVFLVNGTHVEQLFWERLERAFNAEGLEARAYCVLRPDLPHFSYLSLNVLSDIFLDTFEWSGGNTTLEAVGCGLPIVTCPGELMRSRHSCGILRRLGVTDTIAGSPAEYIDIAVRLATDKVFRRDVTQRMAQGMPDLYRDTKCVAALEDFFKAAWALARKPEFETTYPDGRYR